MIWNRHSGGMITKNFHSKEMECHCGICREQVMDEHFLELLQQVRDDYGKPIKITSAVRCTRHQQTLREGGLETAKGISSHEQGCAADIAPLNLAEMPALLASVRKVFSKWSIGIAKTFLHVDTRPGGPRRWTYGK